MENAQSALKKTVGRNMDFKGASGQGLDTNEDVTGSQREGGPHCVVVENPGELCPTVVWKAELVRVNLHIELKVFLSEVLSTVCFPLAVYSKI